MSSVTEVHDVYGAALYIDKYLLVQSSHVLTYIMSTGWVGEDEQGGARRRHAARVVFVGEETQESVLGQGRNRQSQRSSGMSDILRTMAFK